MSVKLWATLFFMLFNFKAMALVTLESGEYSVNAVDFEITDQKAPFKFFRFYNHRAQPYGIFGSKWCSSVEQELRSNARGYMGYACGLPTQMLFVKNEKIKLKNKDVAYAWDTETLIKLGNNKGFIRYSQNNDVMVYNEFGRLLSISTRIQKKYPLVRIFYNDKTNLIQKIVYDHKDQYIFKYNENNLVTRIQGPKKKKSLYTYNDKNLLVSVKNFWKNKFDYTYDEKNRITQIQFPKNQYEKIQYDSKMNLVAQTIDQLGCKTEYKRDLNLKQSVLKLTMVNDCKTKPQIFTTSRSPLFFKNKPTIEKLSEERKYHAANRTPASLPRQQVTSKIKEIKGIDYVYQYSQNDKGQTLQIFEINKKLNKRTGLRLHYKNNLLTSVVSQQYGQLNYVYNNQGVLVKTFAGDQKPETAMLVLEIYSRFLSSYELAQKDKRE